MPRFNLAASPAALSGGRFLAPIEVVDLQTLKSGFSGQVERERMARVRSKIEVVRKAWLDNDAYFDLVESVRRWCKPESLPEDVREPLTRLLDGGFRDYADVQVSRGPSTVKAPSEQYDALEMYCSIPGYDYLFKLVSDTLRSEHASDEHLLVATTLIEFLTIDLYNLRLSQLGDPRYENFEGLTHRGMPVFPETVTFYEDMLSQSDLTLRGFAIPLAMTSTSTDARIMEDFAETKSPGGQRIIHMHFQVHTRGIDETLLKAYRQRYPDSVVTSICAMPVANVSPEDEKEILLRGAFFQLLKVERTTTRSGPDGAQLVKITVVTMNSNRDHSTESSSNVDDKRVQREIFRRLVDASKYKACAELAAEFKPEDVDGYKTLSKKMIDEVREMGELDLTEFDAPPLVADEDRPSGVKEDVAVWLGGRLTSSYPRNYVQRRKKWHAALMAERWVEALKVLEKEYEWRKTGWYNLSPLRDPAETGPPNDDDNDDDEETSLHALLQSIPPPDKKSEDYRAWESLVEGMIGRRGVWSKQFPSTTLVYAYYTPMRPYVYS